MRKLILSKPILVYFSLVFTLSWCIWITTAVVAPQYFIAATLLGAWSPTVVALYIIYQREGGQSVKLFLKRLFSKAKWYWYIIVLLTVPVIAALSTGLYTITGGEIAPIKYPAGIPQETPILLVVTISFISGIFFGGPLAEDIGWRGFIVPELHKKMNAFNAAFIVGVVWVIWHLPFFFIEGGEQVVGNIPIYWFAPLTIAWGVLFAWVYFSTKNILLPVLFHSSINTTLGFFGVLNHADGQPNNTLLLIHTVITWVIVFVVVKIYGYQKLAKN